MEAVYQAGHNTRILHQLGGAILARTDKINQD
jgi:hypothetical protein